MKHIAFIFWIVFILVACAGCSTFTHTSNNQMPTVTPNTTVTNNGNLPSQASQVVFLIDDSSSMAELALDPKYPNATRWDVVKRVYPEWVKRLGKDTLVGGRSLGGSCAGSPVINFAVGTDLSTLINSVNLTQPNGATNLNAALQAAPSLFSFNVKGSKHIVVLSDGLNSCSPEGSTCDIVRDLYTKHGITTDIVAWITDPVMKDEFKCATESTGGVLSTPATIEEWINVPLPNVNLWRYVVFLLGLTTLFFATIIFYRHTYHVMGWSVVQSSFSATVLLTFTSLILYGVLFIGYGILTTILGAIAFVAILTLASKSRTRQRTTRDSSSLPIVGLLLLLLLLPINCFADDSNNTPNKPVKNGQPQYHHILVLDVSGSVLRHIDNMKALVSNYANLYTRPDESITLILFAYDETGSAKELHTFKVPPDGSTTILDNLLNDIEIQEPGKTHTYFRPMAEFLKQFLQKVRLEPIILVISDGVSDAESTNVGFKDIVFESLGKRGIYKAPGIKNWRVAIDGGRGLDFGSLFKNQKPLAMQNKTSRKGLPASSTVIDPCLVEPELIVETQEQLILTPSINPFSNKVYGTLQTKISNYCVPRFRTFSINLRKDGQAIPLRKVESSLIATDATDFSFEVSLDAAQNSGEGVLEVIVEQSGMTKVVYPNKPAKIKIEQLSYLGVHWFKSLIVLVGTSGVFFLTLFSLSRRRQNKKTTPEYIKIPGGSAIALYPYSNLTIGGQGCDLVILGVPDNKPLATIEPAGKKGEIRVRPSNGVRLRIGGVDSGVNNCFLGQPFELIDGDQTYQVILLAAKQNEISLGEDISTTSIPVFEDINFPSTTGSLGSSNRGKNSVNSNLDII